MQIIRSVFEMQPALPRYILRCSSIWRRSREKQILRRILHHNLLPEQDPLRGLKISPIRAPFPLLCPGWYRKTLKNRSFLFLSRICPIIALFAKIRQNCMSLNGCRSPFYRPFFSVCF